MRLPGIEDLLGRPLNEYEQRHAPQQLYTEGPMSLPLQPPKVSVVGTRKPTVKGTRKAQYLTKWLADHGITVVSGLAAGIDTIAHRTAIRNGGQTVAVIGTPLDKQYPKDNAQLQREIATNHLVVSQFPSGAPVRRSNFILRNKTMAIISDATVIVEAGDTSGTVHQAREANMLRRPLFVCKPVIEANPRWLDNIMRYGATVLEENEDLLYSIPVSAHVW